MRESKAWIFLGKIGSAGRIGGFDSSALKFDFCQVFKNEISKKSG